MNLEVGKSYILVLEGNNMKLTYNCKILSIDEDSITFLDKYGKTFSYRKDKIISSEEVQR